jgi:maltose alpha-D-glucosyltransferase/alpha-amylase
VRPDDVEQQEPDDLSTPREDRPARRQPHPWWLRTVVYGIQVSAFADSGGDGLGDLGGIIEHLDHIASLGVDTIWLTPTYVSSDRDNGYDVVDHERIDERYGGEETFGALIEAAAERGIRIVVELVANHTSDQHPWFRASRQGLDVPERDRYVWRRHPPAEPTSPGFPGRETSVWTYDERTDEWYRHLFYSFEPDLNVDDADVQAAYDGIIRHWVERGVAGFRLDSAGPMVNRPYRERGDHGPLDNLARATRRFDHRVPIMAEADVPPEEYASFFGDGEEMDLLFNFYISEMLFLALARRSAEPVARALRRLPKPPTGTGYLNYLRNLDELNLDRLDPSERDDVFGAFAPKPAMQIYGRGIRRRVAPMLDGDEGRLRLAWSLLFAMPGIPLVTYGDEIGLGDDLELPERWSVRTAMQWNDEVNAGYSNARGAHVIRPPRPDGRFGYEQVNVAAQEGDPNSLLSWFRRLIAARCSTPEIGWAPWHTVAVDPPSVSAIVYAGDDGRIALFHNLSDDGTRTQIPDELRDGVFEAILPDGAEPRSLGEWLELDGFGYRWFRERRANAR